MSKLSIYQTSWLNLVFEGKNKEYGAYQLRHDSDRTTLSAFGFAVLFCSVVVGTLLFMNSISKTDITLPPLLDETIISVDLETILPPQQNKIKELKLPPVAPERYITETTSQQLINPILVEANLATPEIAKNTDHVSTINPVNTGLVTGTNPTSAVGNDNTAVASTNPNTIVLAGALDKLPEFPGGITKFYNYVGSNFEKPDIEIERAIKIYVSFVVEKDGSMTDIQVKRDPGYGLGAEAIRVLKSLKTKWTPGILNGKAVRTSYNLPISIIINE